jgi:Rubredoxin-like zinc ribbon domain (DUF35_N)/Rieske [2Fe-2S] domain
MTPTAIATRSDRIQRTLEHLRQHTTDTTGQLVPFGPGQYTDPVLAQRERDLVFGRVPSIVAHASELPEPNDFITLQMPRNRVIVAWQHDGSVKAFVNVCRHRGALLEELQSSATVLRSRWIRLDEGWRVTQVRNIPATLPVMPSAGPRDDGLDTPHWEGLREGEVRMQRCARCGHWIWAPQPACPRCHGFEL